MKYNEHLVKISAPDIRQLLIQLRDEHMQNITELQQQIQQLTPLS